MTYHNKFGQRPKPEQSPLIPEIRRVLELLAEPGQVVELRILEVDGKPCTASGYFDDFDKLAEWALRYDGRGSGVYFTLNPVLLALRARCYNRIRDWAKLTTSDREVVARRWLLVDFDARRPSGISSTDEEHQTAVARAKTCRTYLAEKFGWPSPVLSDSGNGAHLLYRINLPNDEQSKMLLETVLQALDRIFSDAQVQLDTGVFNAARICKLYYTLAGKGDSIPDRPHRRSSILEIPETIKAVDITLLEALGALAEIGVAEQANSKTHTSPVNPSNPSYNGSGRYAGSNNGKEVAFIKGRFDLMAYAQKHFPGSVIREGNGETRLVGNQGLLINTERGFWYQHGTGRGGDAIDLVGYVMYGERWNKHDRTLFKTALAEAADFAGVVLAGPVKDKQAKPGVATNFGIYGTEKARCKEEAKALLNLVAPLKLSTRPCDGSDRTEAYVERPLRNKDNFTEFWPIRSRRFYSWLQWQYYEQTGQLPDQQTIYLVADLLEAKAFCEGANLTDNTSSAPEVAGEID